jgi:hypothetical protein
VVHKICFNVIVDRTFELPFYLGSSVPSQHNWRCTIQRVVVLLILNREGSIDFVVGYRGTFVDRPRDWMQKSLIGQKQVLYSSINVLMKCSSYYALCSGKWKKRNKHTVISYHKDTGLARERFPHRRIRPEDVYIGVGDLPSPSLHQIPSWREQNHRRGVPFHPSSLSKAVLGTIEKKSNGRIGGRGCTWFKNRRKGEEVPGEFQRVI